MHGCAGWVLVLCSWRREHRCCAAACQLQRFPTLHFPSCSSSPLFSLQAALAGAAAALSQQRPRRAAAVAQQGLGAAAQPQPRAAGPPLRLVGALRLTAAGWPLHLSYRVHTACRYCKAAAAKQVTLSQRRGRQGNRSDQRHWRRICMCNAAADHILHQPQYWTAQLCLLHQAPTAAAAGAAGSPQSRPLAAAPGLLPCCCQFRRSSHCRRSCLQAGPGGAPARAGA